MFEGAGPVLFCVDRYNVEAGIRVSQLVFKKKIFGSVDQALLFCLCDGLERHAVTAERVIFNFDKDEEILVKGDQVYFSQLRTVIAFNYLEAFLLEVLAGELFAKTADLVADVSHMPACQQFSCRGTYEGFTGDLLR